MRKLMLFPIMAMMMAMLVVATVPDTIPDAPEFTLPDGTFGEKDNAWNTISDFFRGIFGAQEYSFVSDSALPEYGFSADTWYDVYTNTGARLITSSTTQALACNYCSNGEYCYIMYYAYGEWKAAFADHWYKATSSDYLNLKDPKYWTASTGFDYYAGYYCRTPIEVTEYTYTCRQDSSYFVKIYEDDSYVYGQSASKCKLSSYVTDTQLSDSEIRTKLITSVSTCYQCSGGTLLTQAMDGCESGWTTTKPTCLTCYTCDSNDGPDTEYATNSCPSGYTTTKPTCVACYTCVGTTLEKEYRSSCTGDWSSTRPECGSAEPVPCYKCVDGQVAETSVAAGAACPSGYSINEPTQCPVTCWSCDGTETLTQQYLGGCPDGWAPSEPNCEVENVECFACAEGNTGVILKELAPSCQEGWSTVEPSKEQCKGEGNIIDDITQWFKEDAPQSYIIVVSSVLILGALLTVTFGRKPKNGVAL